MKKVKVDDFADAIMEKLQTYADNVNEDTKEAVKKTAKECRDEIKRNSPRKTGDYAKGWKTKTVFENSSEIRVKIHNPKEYRLTHLLEFGHVLKVGNKIKGTVRGKPHIRPVELQANKRLHKRIEEAVKK